MPKRKKNKYSDMFATRLEDLIMQKKKEGITIEKISKSTGIPTGSISKYQNNKGVAGIDSLAILADYFNVTTDYLLGRTNIRSKTKDIQIASATTGLTENSVKVLDSYLLDGRECLNVLLEKNLLSDMLTNIIQYIKNKYIECYNDRKTALKIAEIFKLNNKQELLKTGTDAIPRKIFDETNAYFDSYMSVSDTHFLEVEEKVMLSLFKITENAKEIAFFFDNKIINDVVHDIEENTKSMYYDESFFVPTKYRKQYEKTISKKYELMINLNSKLKEIENTYDLNKNDSKLFLLVEEYLKILNECQKIDENMMIIPGNIERKKMFIELGLISKDYLIKSEDDDDKDLEADRIVFSEYIGSFGTGIIHTDPKKLNY